MVKITSFIVAITATMVATMAAPITPVSETVVATPSSPAESDTPVVETMPAPSACLSSDEAEPTVSISNDGPFSSSIRHHGKATWFTHHYGACNYYWDGYNEPVVALNAHQMGLMSWGNPVCNRQVRVTNQDHPERSIVARIVDKCPGDECAWGSLDLSPFAFEKLGHLDTGVLNITWNYV
ncbi:hypothetical protein EMPS_01912 [Entomortierella parvispora]|uniref:RlpA-like protein double-psi beta-barrel domain-containing protein n=1 Tax=Entomortierella parvispora TaxID=205924 RepID=A0A9P3LTF3_9FUNG|nr:hypothetical protein EMPS_01912 [Entomortierella parvispora]